MKNNFTFKSIFTVFALLLTFSVYAQDRTCGMVEYMEEMLEDPVLAKEYYESQKKFKEELARRVSNGEFSNRGGATIEIPVAVHFPGANEADRACLEALAQNQIDILNADYSATNSDIVQWPAASIFYPGLSPGSANISFCIATSNHPVGLDPELLEGNPCITIGYNFGGGAGNADANWSGYMNFVVRDIGGGLLGFSPLGGSVAAGQAVTMNLGAFGSGAGCPGSGIVPQSPFNLGRTVTHELGHFYNLNHPWGPGAPTCAQDDGIADTPNTGQETYNCPPAGSQDGCVAGQYVLHMNYMDYVNDACMYMFTPGQMAVVNTYVSTVLAPQFKPNVCEPPTPGFNLTANNSPVSSCPDTDTQVDFDLTYSTILDFNETTTFSASGLPANATVSFSPTSLNMAGSVTMTVGNLGATTPGVYTITVTGTSNSVVETVDVVLENNCVECNTTASANNLNLAIPDGFDLSGTNPGAPLTTTLNVADSQTIEGINVNVDISHTYISDLLIIITHPDGVTQAVLWAGNCGSNDNLDITFSDDAAGAPVCGSPTNGTFTPVDPLSVFNGLDAQGDWEIYIQDFFSQDPGTLNDWSIEVCAEANLSINEFEKDNFAIFPNPNNGEFTIKLNSNSGKDIEVDVFDIRGRKIFKNSFTNTGDFNETISLDNVQAGMYLVTVNDGNNEVTKRIIVE